MAEVLYLSILSVSVSIVCEDAIAASLLKKKFGAMAGNGGKPGLSYQIRCNSLKQFEIIRINCEPIIADNVGDFLFSFEKDLIIEIEKIRQDLYFVHAAALKYCDMGCVLVAESGSGKSTTTWAMIHHGFEFLSDELSPIDLNTFDVHPFPQALCLKAKPPPPYTIVEGTLITDWTLHIPVELFPGVICKTPTPLKFIFFLKRYQLGFAAPHAREITAAEAAVRLYSNTLNALAHDELGLDAAIKIARKCRSYEIRTAGLVQTTALLKSLMQIAG